MRGIVRGGFTLVELMCYLGLLGAMMVLMIGAEATAGRMHALEGRKLEVLQQADRVLETIRRDAAWASG